MQRIFLGKKHLSASSPQTMKLQTPFLKKTVFPAGALLLCLILAKACGHSRLCYTSRESFSHLLSSNMKTQNIHSFRLDMNIHELNT